MPIEKRLIQVPRYFIRGDFNPRSPQQISRFMKSQGDFTETTDKKTLEQLAKKNPFYKDILDYRAVQKVESTYCTAIKEKLAKSPDKRIHAQFKHRPSTLRLSGVNPNLTNVVGDKTKNTIAAGFKKVITASEGCVLVEADFSAIEALLTGYFIKDPAFMRLAKLGIHAYHASHILNRPASLSWPDSKLASYFSEIKAADKVQYDKSKICTYSTLYGSSAAGMQRNFPEIFPDVRSAAKNQELLYALCPTLPKWHTDLRLKAHKQGFLGGPGWNFETGDGHPWGYRHWFWDVFTWDSRKGQHKLGKDAKRVVAYYPQSTAAGILKEACLRLLDPENVNYIGDAYFGKTPVRALIHDSILCEVEKKHLLRVLKALKEEMTRAIPQLPCPLEWGFGPYLSIGVAIKIGPNWGSMETWEEGSEIGLASDMDLREDDPEEQEEAEAYV